jgi:hypothetical protein
MSVGNIKAQMQQTVTAMRKRAVLQIDTQMRYLGASNTVDVLQSSLQAMSIRKPRPGSIAQILNLTA